MRNPIVGLAIAILLIAGCSEASSSSSPTTVVVELTPATTAPSTTTTSTATATTATIAIASSNRNELVDLYAEWASEMLRGSPLADPDEITDAQAECMGEHLVDALVGVESVEDVDKGELDERLETAQRGLDYEANSGMYLCFHEELVDVYAGFASDGFADFYFYSGFLVPTVTGAEAECIGEYMVDTYQSNVEYVEYVDADDMSFVANLAMLSCLDMNRYLAAELTQAWGISDGEAGCVIEAMFEEYPVDTVAAGELDRNDVVALAIAAGCISEDQLVEEP